MAVIFGMSHVAKTGFTIRLDYSSRLDPCATRIVESEIVRLSSLPFSLGSRVVEEPHDLATH